MVEAAGVAAQAALTRQSIAIETLKIANEQTQSLLAMIEQSIQSVPVSSTNGANIDISV